MAVEAGPGREEASPASKRVHKMKKEADVELMLKVVLAAKRSLKRNNCAEVQALVRSQ